MAGEFGNEPAEIWVFGDGRYSSDMRPGGSRYHHYDTVRALRAEVERLTEQRDAAENNNREWLQAFQSDEMPDLVTPGHAYEWASGMLRERNEARLDLGLSRVALEQSNARADSCQIALDQSWSERDEARGDLESAHIYGGHIRTLLEAEAPEKLKALDALIAAMIDTPTTPQPDPGVTIGDKVECGEETG